MPVARTPLGREAREGGDGGAPSQKTCRPPRSPSNPSRKEDSCPGFVLGLLVAAPRRGRRRVRLARCAAAARIGSSRCRRRPPSRCSPSAPARRWSPSTTSPTTRSRPRARRSPASRPNVEAIAGYKPDLVDRRVRPERPRRHAPQARDPRARPGRGEEPRRGLRPDPRARQGHRPASRSDPRGHVA